MKKYVGQRLTSYWLAKNLGKMMLLPANANACLSAQAGLPDQAGPPFYPPARFFAKAKVGELAINELSK